ncbi:MAG: hypothetical protein IT337_10585 [Thermomicrobiales bacterium]|nr:hypothetical protein [Thermomicrobiales bacterium]
MIYFRNDTKEYISWLERHPNAYVLNVSTGGKHKAMLHTSRCGHLYQPDPMLAHTETNPKACSRHRDELERWGADASLAVSPCPDCKP